MRINKRWTARTKCVGQRELDRRLWISEHKWLGHGYLGASRNRYLLWRDEIAVIGAYVCFYMCTCMYKSARWRLSTNYGFQYDGFWYLSSSWRLPRLISCLGKPRKTQALKGFFPRFFFFNLLFNVTHFWKKIF